MCGVQEALERGCVLKTYEPTSIEEIASIVASESRPLTFGNVAHPHPFAIPTIESTSISLKNYCGIIEHDVSDQVVVVRAGTLLSDLQAELAKQGQCLPFAQLDAHQTTATATLDTSLIDAIAFNLPHPLHAQCGSWRDWIIGMRLVQADGTIAKCGSKAVKNVAGYDVQKLMIGARNSLGLVAEVTFKTFPIRGLPASNLQVAAEHIGKSPTWIQRVQPTDFDKAVQAGGRNLAAIDRASSTLWAVTQPDEGLKRFSGDWILRSNAGARNLEFADPTVVRLISRTKELFDPAHKLNPGAMGIV